MKINLRNEAGNILTLTLVSGATLGIGLASYFTLIQAQNNAVMRSQNWNSAIPAAEAGLEDALTHLNVVGDASRATNGWTQAGTNYWISRSFASYRYEVGIDQTSQPTIYATGYVRAPKGTSEISRVIRVTTSRYGTGLRGMVAIGDVTMNGGCVADSFDSSDPAFSTGGVYDPAKRKDLSYVASVQGSVSGVSVYGNVATGPTGGASGDVGDFAWRASHSGIEAGHYQKDLNVSFPPAVAPFTTGLSPEQNVSITTTNYTYGSSTITTNVYPNPAPAGGVTSSTQTYTSSTYPSGSTGITTNSAATSSKTYPSAGTYVGNVTTRVVTSGPPSGRGTWYDYAAITGYNYTTTVYTYSTTTTNATTATATYDYVLRTGNYVMNGVSMSGQTKMLIMGDAVLYNSGDFSMTGQATITILPGASLKIYSAGASTQFAGNGILNQSGDTTKFSYYGLPSNTSLSLSGNASFTGSIYAPSADFSLNGGGNNSYDLVGASVTKTVSMHGHFNFHYDERLGRSGGASRYNVASWDEITIF